MWPFQPWNPTISSIISQKCGHVTHNNLSFDVTAALQRDYKLRQNKVQPTSGNMNGDGFELATYIKTRSYKQLPKYRTKREIQGVFFMTSGVWSSIYSNHQLHFRLTTPGFLLPAGGWEVYKGLSVCLSVCPSLKTMNSRRREGATHMSLVTYHLCGFKKNQISFKWLLFFFSKIRSSNYTRIS